MKISGLDVACQIAVCACPWNWFFYQVSAGYNHLQINSRSLMSVTGCLLTTLELGHTTVELTAQLPEQIAKVTRIIP